MDTYVELGYQIIAREVTNYHRKHKNYRVMHKLVMASVEFGYYIIVKDVTYHHHMMQSITG